MSLCFPPTHFVRPRTERCCSGLSTSAMEPSVQPRCTAALHQLTTSRHSGFAQSCPSCGEDGAAIRNSRVTFPERGRIKACSNMFNKFSRTIFISSSRQGVVSAICRGQSCGRPPRLFECPRGAAGCDIASDSEQFPRLPLHDLLDPSSEMNEFQSSECTNRQITSSCGGCITNTLFEIFR